MGASLLIFLNKTDVEGGMTEDEVREVGCFFQHTRLACAVADLLPSAFV